MADQSLSDIFHQAAGQNPPEALEKEASDVKDIFKSAHDQEEAKAAAPSQMKEASKDSPDQWSKLQSFGQGALQGATAGFSDEIGGALGAAMEKIQGNPQNKSLKDLYQEYRDMQRGRNEQAHKQNPGSNLAGNVAGAIGGGILAPELMAPKSVAGAVGLGAATGLGTSDQDLTEATPDTLKGAAKDTAIGGGIGLLGGLAGKGLQKVLNPEALDVAASKAASSAVGIKPSKELARIYDPATRQMVQGSNVIKGIGKTALDEGALPMTGGPNNIYDKSLEAIDNQYKKLGPIMSNAQQKLDQNMDQNLQAVGGIGQKASDFLYDFRSSLDQNPNQNKIMDTLEEKYLPYIQKLTNADGNLQQLTQFKRGLQETATDLNKAAYTQPASDLKPEAEFVKNLGGIVRQHIEDLASQADEGAGQQIAQTNKTLSNLYSYNDAAKKLMDKTSSGLMSNVQTGSAAGAGFLAGGPIGAAVTAGGKLALEGATGNPLNRLAKMATAKIANQTSKAIQTPAGELAQKAVVNIPLNTVTNPFTQGQVQEKYNPSAQTKLATNMYNATNDSLKEVASTFKSHPALGFYGDMLNDAVDTDDQIKKNNAIFCIMQNPTARKLITPTDEVKKQDESALKKFVNR